MRTKYFFPLLAALLVCGEVFAGISTGPGGTLSGTDFAKTLLESTNSASARAALGIADTNVTVTLLPDNSTVKTNSNGQFFVTNSPSLGGVDAASYALLSSPATDIRPGVLSSNLALTVNLVPRPLDNDQRPPRGYSTFEKYGVDITESNILEDATNYLESGLTKYGWNWIEIGDGWQGERDTNGIIHEDTDKFPSGLSNVIHILRYDMGFHVGLYHDAALLNCSGLPGAAGCESNDITLFKEWGVEGLSSDTCRNTNETFGRYQQESYAKAIQDIAPNIYWTHYTGWKFPVVPVSGSNIFLPWMSRFANAVGYFDEWDGTKHPWTQIIDRWDMLKQVIPYFGKNHAWYGPAMNSISLGVPSFLQRGNLEFALWYMGHGPMRNEQMPILYPTTRYMFTNSEALRIHEDRLRELPRETFTNGTMTVLTEPLDNGDKAILFINRSTNTTASGIMPLSDSDLWPGTYIFHDIWENTNCIVEGTNFSYSVAGQSCMWVRAMPYTPENAYKYGLATGYPMPELPYRIPLEVSNALVAEFQGTNTCYVDAVNGDDSTAVVGDPSHPAATITFALTNNLSASTTPRNIWLAPNQTYTWTAGSSAGRAITRPTTIVAFGATIVPTSSGSSEIYLNTNMIAIYGGLWDWTKGSLDNASLFNTSVASTSFQQGFKIAYADIKLINMLIAGKDGLQFTNNLQHSRFYSQSSVFDSGPFWKTNSLTTIRDCTFIADGTASHGTNMSVAISTGNGVWNIRDCRFIATGAVGTNVNISLKSFGTNWVNVSDCEFYGGTASTNWLATTNLSAQSHLTVADGASINSSASYPLSVIQTNGYSTAPFTNNVYARIPFFTNSDGVTVYLTLSTNVP